LKVSDRFMPKQKILQADRDYTFRSYFELAEDPDEILATNCFRPLHSENEMALPLHDAIAPTHPTHAIALLLFLLPIFHCP
jgi:hypothetical protein